MPIRKLSVFLLQSAAVGLVAAAALLLLKPELFRGEPAVVEVREPAPAGSGASAPTGGEWSGPTAACRAC